MSVMAKIDELLVILVRLDEQNGTNIAQPLIDETCGLARRLANEISHAIDGIEVGGAPDFWDDSVMVGLHPYDGDYGQPIPDALKGIDDAGWVA